MFLNIAKSVATGAMVLFAIAACQTGPADPTNTAAPPLLNTLSEDQVITLGDIDPDEPAKKIKRFQPLADFLADRLLDYGIERGRVVVARDIEEMAGFLKDGRVDVYFDSPFPTLAVQELSDSSVVLRRWKQGEPTYWSVYIALRDSGIARVEDFAGKVVAFEEPHSTSGFLLPAGTLIQRGLTIRAVGRPEEAIHPREIGYVFSWDEETP